MVAPPGQIRLVLSILFDEGTTNTPTACLLYEREREDTETTFEHVSLISGGRRATSRFEVSIRFLAYFERGQRKRKTPTSVELHVGCKYLDTCKKWSKLEKLQKIIDL